MRRSWKIDNLSKINFDVDKQEIEVVSREDATREVDKVMVISAWRLQMLVRDYLELFKESPTYLYGDNRTKQICSNFETYIENMKKEGYLR